MFAAYDPQAHGQPIRDLRVRELTTADCPACARILVERGGGDIAEQTSTFERWLDDAQRFVVVAERDGEVLGFGKAIWLTPVRNGGRGAPDGWYLGGVVVAPRWRRLGVGRRLTVDRLERLSVVTDTVWYVASRRNQSSIDLHARLGFTFVTDDFIVPGVTFTGETGGLFRWSANRRSAES